MTAISGSYEVRGRTDLSVPALRYDSRRVQRGDLYVAVNGRDDHGVEYVAEAIRAGAAIVVTDAPGKMPFDPASANDVTLVVVEDARRAMAEMAHALFGNPGDRLKLFAVTGTNGKTTVTYVLRQLLEACGDTTGVIGTLGKMLGRTVPTGYTTPESPELAEILAEMLDHGFRSVAMEVSSHALALDRVATLRFAGAIFTNLTQDHLDFHLSMQEYHDAKKLLFDGLDAGRPALVNIDDLYGESMVRDSNADILRYGKRREADLQIGGVELGATCSRWKLNLSERLGGGSVTLVTPLLGAFNIWNITGAMGLALAAGYDRELLFEAVASLRPVPGRMESIPLGNGATAVVDYAHTPDALENVLRGLREIGGGGNLTVVFGCGGDRDRGKRSQMGRIAGALADRVILTSDNPRSEDPEEIIDEIEAGIEPGRGRDRIADRATAIITALESATPGSLVLIAGKGHEDYQIIGAERIHFNDGEVVRQWIAGSHANHREGIPAA
ncbi:MAG: UDP-N-acetylmuramoylalanyl-D-glutamate--2,6-diaminopimelate ligase [Chlorobi bacterium]|nr:UDP-N-acetylmuramoylalanyl-D-glutamate--2,6-diaminopimelate ligase [Chlorobiota bacterium]